VEVAKSIVLDANIVISTVLGVGARRLVNAHAGEAWLCAPQEAFDDARRHLPTVAHNRGWADATLAAALEALGKLEHLVHPIEPDTYASQLTEAHLRIDGRDPKDAPILATSLLLSCPIWTEDQDFFGTGVATWTTDRVELYLSPDRPSIHLG